MSEGKGEGDVVQRSSPSSLPPYARSKPAPGRRPCSSSERPSHSIRTMPKDPEPSHLQRDFTLAAIKAGVRTDGRRLDEARPWALEWVGGEDGGVECRLGKTRCAPSPLPCRPRPRRLRLLLRQS